MRLHATSTHTPAPVSASLTAANQQVVRQQERHHGIELGGAVLHEHHGQHAVEHAQAENSEDEISSRGEYQSMTGRSDRRRGARPPSRIACSVPVGRELAFRRSLPLRPTILRPTSLLPSCVLRESECADRSPGVGLSYLIIDLVRC